MPKRIAKYFIATALGCFLIGCLEGLMFPTKFRFSDLYSTLFHIPPEHIKSFFGHFVAKIHTHVNLVGWVGSALMGILYYLVPQISGVERYSPLAAYGNWICQTAGIVLLVTGFHMIGVVGLPSGFAAGSPEFRSVAAPFKTLVSAGGILIMASAILFTFNMVRTLFARRKRVHGKARTATVSRHRAAAMVIVAVFGATLFATTTTAVASPSKALQRIDVIMVGDRLVDVAAGLGVVPAAMSVRCSLWPKCKTLQAAGQVLGCPGCLFKKKLAPVLKFTEKHGKKKVLIERSAPFCEYMPDLELNRIAKMLKEKGFEIDVVDFTKGLEPAVRQTAQLVGRTENADKLLAKYHEAMEKTRKRMAGKKFVRQVVIINGTYQAETGKAFLRVEAPGGYADRFLLEEMGCKNVGDRLYAEKKVPSKGHVAVRKLNKLIKASPDAIVMTGDAVAVQKAIAKAVSKNPALADVPAIQNQAIFSLPGYVDAGVIEYPLILRRWADALSRP